MGIYICLELIKNKYNDRAKNLGEETFLELQRIVLLHTLDVAWREHLYELDHLRKGIGLRAYGQKDPLIEYKKESFMIFGNMQNRIREQTIEYIFKLQPLITQQSPRTNYQQNVNYERPEGSIIPSSNIPSGQKQLTQQKSDILSSSTTSAAAVKHKIGRNEPYPCGSGKKYKKCCGQ